MAWGLELLLLVGVVWGALGLLRWKIAAGVRNEIGLGRNARQPRAGFAAE